MKAYAIKPGEPGRMIEIENTLEALQGFVDGYIETVYICEDLVVICNEEGRTRNMDYCCEICGVMFYGPILICGEEKRMMLTDIPLDEQEAKEYLGVE